MSTLFRAALLGLACFVGISGSHAAEPAELADTASGRKPGVVRSLGETGIKFCWCPAGSFRMGSPEGDQDAQPDERPQVDVKLSKGFWLGQTEVTQGPWKRHMQTEPWVKRNYTGLFSAGDDYPVVYVMWDEAVEFCRKLTEAERAAGRLPATWEFALPTEAQWEYACRAGTTTRFSSGDEASKLSEFAWILEDESSRGEPSFQKVGAERPNAWNLHDMHGNVMEWCRDIYVVKLAGGDDPLSDSAEPSTLARGPYRMERGGSWLSSPAEARSSYRGDWSTPDNLGVALGFRVACVHAK